MHTEIQRKETKRVFSKEQDHKKWWWGGRKDWHLQHNGKMRNYNDSSISECQMRKRWWRPSPEIMIELSGLAEDLLCQMRSMAVMMRCWFTDELKEESSELSSEPEESIRNLTSLNEIFQIVPCQMDGNWLFHTLNNLVFGRQYSTEEIRNEIYILIRKKHLYKNLWESDFDTHIRNIKRNGFWGTNLEKNSIFWYDEA